MEPSSRLCHTQMASRRGITPGVAVYFVLLSLMALIAACLMWSGVGKSGSPGPKSAMSTPLAFSWSAAAMTAAVGEIWIRLMRSVSCTASPCELQNPSTTSGVEKKRSRNFRFDALFDNRWNKSCQRRAELRDFAHELRTQIAVCQARQHKYRFEAAFEFAVHQRHLQFVFIVADRANAPENHTGTTFARVVHEQSVEDIHFHVRPLFSDFTQHFDAFSHGEKRLLLCVLQDGDNEQVKHLLAALDQ